MSQQYPKVLGLVILLIAVAFLVAIVCAAQEGSVLDGLLEISNSPWGMVTLFDLGIGLAFGAFWITAIVGIRRSWPWILAILLLGNLALLVFLIVRLRHSNSWRSLFLRANEVQ